MLMMANRANRWGAIIVKARTAGWIRKVGRERPKSTQSHTMTLVRWQSLIYKGEERVTPQSWNGLVELHKRHHLREITLMEALWAAFEAGTEM